MTAAMLYRQAIESGVSLRLVDGKVKVSGNAALLAEFVPQLREHKPELIQLLQEAHETTTALIAAAMRACDHFNDGPAAREQMRNDCLATPPHLTADLLAHFNETYPKVKP